MQDGDLELHQDGDGDGEHDDVAANVETGLDNLIIEVGPALRIRGGDGPVVVKRTAIEEETQLGAYEAGADPDEGNVD